MRTIEGEFDLIRQPRHRPVESGVGAGRTPSRRAMPRSQRASPQPTGRGHRLHDDRHPQAVLARGVELEKQDLNRVDTPTETVTRNFAYVHERRAQATALCLAARDHKVEPTPSLAIILV